MTGSELKKKRNKLGLTQTQLAERLGYSSYLRVLEKEKGRSTITKQDLIILGYMLEEQETFVGGIRKPAGIE